MQFVKRELLVTACELCLLLALAWMLASMFFSMPLDVQQTALHTQSAQSNDSQAVMHMQPLFGQLAVQKKAPTLPTQQPKHVRKSQLNIELLGTITGGHRPAAIVLVQGQAKQKLVFQGNDLLAGVRLFRVETTSIVLQRGSDFERIHVKWRKPLMASPSLVATDVPINFKRSALQQELKDLPRLLSQAKALPYIMNGKAYGFVLQDIAPGSLYAKAGLRNGDVIRRVNGKPVTTIEQGMAMYQSLQDAPFIRLQIERAGKPQTLNYQVQ